MSLPCHLCGFTEKPIEIPGFPDVPRITSDCKPWPAGGKLFLCPSCGMIYKPPDELWLDEIQRIYTNYTIYYQSGGFEQPVFVPETGQLTSRSRAILDRCLREVGLPTQGRALDVGCGNGAFLRTFGQLYPAWRLVGTEFDAKYKAMVEALPHVEVMHTGSVDELEGKFDLASLIHVLEHIPWPTPLLASIRAKLEEGGHLIVDLPDYQLNPFDLIVADHCSHFTEAALCAFLARCGFRAERVTSDWIPKERVAIARPGPVDNGAVDFQLATTERTAREAVDFLLGAVSAARRLRSAGPFGIFGTSIAGTWLRGALEDGGGVDFWVDEDQNRIGREHFDRPILSIEQVPAGSSVFLCMSSTLGKIVKEKAVARNPKARWLTPADVP